MHMLWKFFRLSRDWIYNLLTSEFFFELCISQGYIQNFNGIGEMNLNGD